MFQKKLTVYLIFLLLALSLTGSFLLHGNRVAAYTDPVVALAKTTPAKWQNAFSINIGPYSFLDTTIGNAVNPNSDTFIIQNAPSVLEKCDFLSSFVGSGSGELVYALTNSCAQNNTIAPGATETIHVDLSTVNRQSSYFVIGGNGGQVSTGNGRRLYSLSGTNTYKEAVDPANSSPSSCNDTITLNSSDINTSNGQLKDVPGNASIVIMSQNTSANMDSYPQYFNNYNLASRGSGTGCDTTIPISIWISNTAPPNGPSKRVAPTVPTSSPTNGNPTATDPCNSNSFAESWLVCPIVSVLQHGVDAANRGVSNLLNIPVNNYFSNNCTGGATNGCNTSGKNYQIWSNMRNIGLSLLVIAALIMVIATAIDIGPFDAYTVKKILPRIVIAVFAITLSWQIARLIVQLSDDLGYGISQLIYSAAGLSSATVLNNIGQGFLAWLGVGGAVAAGATLVTVATVGPLATLMLLLPLLLGFAIAFFVLIIRRLIIVVCVVFAPIALVAFILPGTQRVWKLWKDSFVGALFVFPMITAVIAMGGVLASLVESGNGGSSFLAPLTALILFIGPFFLIPKLVRISTGALGAIHGVMSNSGKGWFAGLKKARQNQWAQKRARSGAGALYSDRNRVTRKLSSMGLGLASGAKGHYGLGGRGRSAIDSRARMGAAEAERDPQMQQLQYDDDGVLAMYLSAGDAKTGREELAALGWQQTRIDSAMNTASATGINRAHSIAAGGLLMRNKARSLTPDQNGIDALDRAADRLGGGNDQLTNNIRGNVQFWARQSGASVFGGNTVADGWARTNMGQLAQDTTPALQSHLNEIRNNITSGSITQRRQAAIQLSEARALLPNTSATNQTAINDTLRALSIDPTRDQDSQIANIASGLPAPGGVGPMLITAAEISTTARKYDSGTPYAARPGAYTPPPPPGGDTP